MPGLNTTLVSVAARKLQGDVDWYDNLMGKHCTVSVYDVRLTWKTHAHSRTRANQTQMCEANPPLKNSEQTADAMQRGSQSARVAGCIGRPKQKARGPVGAWLHGCGRTVGGPNLRRLPPTPQWLPPLPNHSFSAAAHISLQATATHHGI